MNKLFERFGQPFEWMSKMDNAKRTGKPFEWMKVLLIHTIGLPIVQMNKLLKWFWKPFQAHGLIMERVMLLCIVCHHSQFQGLYSQDRKWRLFQFLIKIMFLVIV